MRILSSRYSNEDLAQGQLEAAAWPRSFYSTLTQSKGDLHAGEGTQMRYNSGGLSGFEGQTNMPFCSSQHMMNFNDSALPRQSPSRSQVMHVPHHNNGQPIFRQNAISSPQPMLVYDSIKGGANPWDDFRRTSSASLTAHKSCEQPVGCSQRAF